MVAIGRSCDRRMVRMSEKGCILEDTLILETIVKNVAYGNKKVFFLSHIHFL